MDTLRIRPLSSPIQATLEMPGDKSISHRAVLLAALSDGLCHLQNFLPSEDCLATLQAIQSLGVRTKVLKEMEGYGATELAITGKKMQLNAPQSPIDCGNSGTGMRLLAGLLAAQKFSSTLTGDHSLCSRPMQRIIQPLEAMGALIKAQGKKEGCAPLYIEPSRLQPIDYTMPMASAQVKSAILLAGLFTPGKTTVRQPMTTRDHTERLLEAFRIRPIIDGNTISVYGGQQPQNCDIFIPGDLSSAAFWMVAAASLPGSLLRIENVGLNPTRTAIINVLIRMGAKLKDVIISDHKAEPYGHLIIEGTTLHATDILPEEIPNLIDEIPIIAIAASLAQGTTTIRNARELRVKESDRIATVAQNLRAMGGLVEEYEDGLSITGRHGDFPLDGAQLDSFGDHRIAMAFAIASLFAKGSSTIHNCQCIDTSYPGFARHLDYISA